MRHHTFDGKAHRLFWNLMVNDRLEAILSDKKLKALGLKDMGQLLLRLTNIPSTAAYVAAGTQPLGSTATDLLIRICDPYATQRDELRGQINMLNEELRSARTRPLTSPSYDEIQNQQLTVKALNQKLAGLQKEFDALPARNTLPEGLFDFPSKEKLIDLGLITLKADRAPKLAGKKTSEAPFLTEERKRIRDHSVKLVLDVEYVLKTGGQISTSFIEQTHRQAQEVYRECSGHR
jgi:hypothetical protein